MTIRGTTGRRGPRRPVPDGLVRQREPRPLIRRRMPAGVGSMLQPNVTGDGEARLTARFWLLVVATGVAAGLAGDLMMLLLFTVEHLAFGVGYDGNGFTEAVERAGDVHRFVPLLVAAVIAGVGWYLLRRFTPGKKSEVDEILWTGRGRLSFRRSLGTSVLSEVVIGLGVSLGRENAPKLMGAVAGSVFSGWAGLTAPQRRLLVACGGGAGLAAVYNVPLGGALFTAEVLLGSMILPVIMPALLCAAVATLTSWVFLPSRATYGDVPGYHFSVQLMVWAVIVGPLIGLFAVGFIRLLGWVTHHRITGRRAIVAPLLGFPVLGLLAFEYPQLYGNGKGMAHAAFLGQGTIALLLALAVLKPLVTSLCLGVGASGGLFTPTMSSGAVLGGGLGLVWNLILPNAPVGAFAMVGAAAMIGAGMQAPLAGLALVLELTHAGFAIMVPMAVATVLATAVTRWLDGYSIYSARLTAPASVDV